MTAKKLNLWQKLVEIRKQVAYIKKEAKGFNYNYADGEAVLSRIVPLMNDLNVLLKSEVIQVQPQVWHGKDKYGKDKDEMLYVVPMTMTWINADNPEEREECQWAGTGCNGEEKGYGSALTYAERYFMLKFFNIATGKDDPDNYENTTRNHQEPAQQATTPPLRPELGDRTADYAATDALPPDPAKWDEHIEKQKMFRKLATDYPGVEMLAIPTMPDMKDRHQKMMVKEKRTADEKKELVKAYILSITDVPSVQLKTLYALSVFKDKAGFYGGIKTYDALDALKDDKKLNMLYTAAKGAAIHVAQVAANKV